MKRDSLDNIFSGWFNHDLDISVCCPRWVSIEIVGQREAHGVVGHPPAAHSVGHFCTMRRRQVDGQVCGQIPTYLHSLWATSQEVSSITGAPLIAALMACCPNITRPSLTSLPSARCITLFLNTRV